MSATKFFHSEDIYNLQSPREIVPVLVQVFQPKSVVDFGCGLGTFLYCFKEQGVPKVLGMDGDWVDRSLLKKYLDENEFISTDLQKADLVHKERYDLAISLEVAEHLSPESADRFIENMTSLSDNIVFSAAIPGQGGQDHVNEQWPSYWIAKFEKHGYFCHDILRPYFWNNPNVLWWYKQNILVFSKDPSFTSSLKLPRIFDLAHPEMLKANSETLSGFRFASKLFVKALLKKMGVRK
ncbi:class I SAM-dependent methyltransferase [Dyadobacter sp. CY261]|uniref:class I SAM-dependent methyltransferase n=1 Tax=Dyadobacter sp. CY261 TaxID=2907203 RepID=UPI001F27C484|nr:class I SAM-dependent methyltransferase [Dyadobacter sp. CY261]MCF0069894.1 class I SAM-dependent methyltransferase [Dyadobacter sp. CY261]